MEAGIRQRPAGGPGLVQKRRTDLRGAKTLPLQELLRSRGRRAHQIPVNKTNAGDEWFWLDAGTWRRIPDDIIHWNKHAPGGRPTLFVYSGKETCFYPGEGGV